MLLLNAFSANMLGAFPASISFEAISLENARALAAEGFTSAVGHADTAAVFSGQLGVPVLAQRATVTLKQGDMALLGQYKGPRLPEGATQLPEGAEIAWITVKVN